MKRIVIKIGRNILAHEREGLDTRRISTMSRDISDVQDKGYDVVVVSSGAIAAGMRKLGLKTKPKDIKFKQAAAAVGQSALMWAYERSFGNFGKKVAQVLLTRDDFADRKRYINAKNTPSGVRRWIRASRATTTSIVNIPPARKAIGTGSTSKRVG